MIDKILDFIRGSVRPIVTYMVVGVLCILTYRIGFKFATEQIALLIIGAFISLTATLSTYWFVTREKNKP